MAGERRNGRLRLPVGTALTINETNERAEKLSKVSAVLRTVTGRQLGSYYSEWVG
jgi:hypothetical protein